MIPLKATDTLESFLSGAGTHKVIVIYYDVSKSDKTDNSDYKRERQITASNGTSDVTICDAPQQGYMRHVEEIFFNPDATITITIQYDVSGTESRLITQAVTANETLHYSRGLLHIL